MANSWFEFKQFRIIQEKSAFKVGTDGVLLGAWAGVQTDNRILDIGSGTGLLALMIAQRTKAKLEAIEPDTLSYEEARVNISSSPWGERIKVHNTDLDSFVASSPGKFDHMVSNPPYFRESLINTDRRLAQARHTFSLTPGDLLSATRSLLLPGGKLSLILPYEEGNLFIADASSYDFYCNRMLRVRPSPGMPVKRLLMEFSSIKKPLSTGLLTIDLGSRHTYTNQYKKLTRDYYLNF